MFTSMIDRVSTNTYGLARTRRFNRRSENSVGRVTHQREAPTDNVQLVLNIYIYIYVYIASLEVAWERSRSRAACIMSLVRESSVRDRSRRNPYTVEDVEHMTSSSYIDNM